MEVAAKADSAQEAIHFIHSDVNRLLKIPIHLQTRAVIMKNQFLVKRDLHFLPAQAATLRREKDQKDSEHSKEAIFKFFPGIAHYSSKRVILFFGLQFLERTSPRKVAALRRRLDLKEARHGKPFNPSLLIFLLGIWPGHGHRTLQRAGAASRSQGLAKTWNSTGSTASCLQARSLAENNPSQAGTVTHN